MTQEEIDAKARAMRKLPKNQGQTEAPFQVGYVEDCTSLEGQEEEDRLCELVTWTLRGSVRYVKRGKSIEVWSGPNPSWSRRDTVLNSRSRVA